MATLYKCKNCGMFRTQCSCGNQEIEEIHTPDSHPFSEHLLKPVEHVPEYVEGEEESKSVWYRLKLTAFVIYVVTAGISILLTSCCLVFIPLGGESYKVFLEMPIFWITATVLSIEYLYWLFKGGLLLAIAHDYLEVKQ